jgi:UDP-N-acetyl-D-galactosamine dehydrogenase
MDVSDIRIAVIGLGYVGLPLAVEFAKVVDVVGYDINPVRVSALRDGVDATLEINSEDLKNAGRLEFTSDPALLHSANIFIVTTPTPIDAHKQPDLGALSAATRTIAKVLKTGDIVVYESTVYPGATEEVCVPILESESGLKLNTDFGVGYSPERINPGDKKHRLPTIVKVTSGSDDQTAELVDSLYSLIIAAGTYRASSIKVAEAAKVIENTQRDLNIALINELSLLFDRLGVDTEEVLRAAGTKWNFLQFWPGLVGGHCIGVDPYYLTYKAQAVGFHPELILAGRRLNDSMGELVAARLVKSMVRKNQQVVGSRILILGLTFKENTPDLRNTRIIDVVEELQGYGARVDVHDPWADQSEAKRLYDIDLLHEIPKGAYSAIILAVGHDAYRDLSAADIREYGHSDGVTLFDLKYVLPASDSDLRL